MTHKRGNDEGSIYKRGDGRWVAVIHLGYEGGRRRRKSFYAATRSEVAIKLAAALKAHAEALPIPGERQTTAQYLNHWLEQTVKPNVRRSTYRGYEAKLRVHIIPGLGRITLVKLSAERVQSFFNDRLRSGLSPQSVRHLKAILRAALNDALRWGLVARNVAALVDGPRVHQKEIRPLVPAEARQLLEAVRGDRLAALYTVALALGLRQGEALGLRWEDVDLEAGILSVRVALERSDSHFRLIEPKTRQSRRTIALPEVALRALRSHRANQLEERLLVGSDWEDTWGLVFTTPTGAPLYGGSVTRQFQEILVHAGLPRQRFHDLRHACASLLLVQGVHPRVVMETLGHSRIALTMDTYSHVIPELQREAATKMDSLLASR
jgi:integrase